MEAEAGRVLFKAHLRYCEFKYSLGNLIRSFLIKGEEVGLNW